MMRVPPAVSPSREISCNLLMFFPEKIVEPYFAIKDIRIETVYETHSDPQILRICFLSAGLPGGEPDPPFNPAPNNPGAGV